MFTQNHSGPLRIPILIFPNRLMLISDASDSVVAGCRRCKKKIDALDASHVVLRAARREDFLRRPPSVSRAQDSRTLVEGQVTREKEAKWSSEKFFTIVGALGDARIRARWRGKSAEGGGHPRDRDGAQDLTFGAPLCLGRGVSRASPSSACTRRWRSALPSSR